MSEFVNEYFICWVSLTHPNLLVTHKKWINVNVIIFIILYRLVFEEFQKKHPENQESKMPYNSRKAIFWKSGHIHLPVFQIELQRMLNSFYLFLFVLFGYRKCAKTLCGGSRVSDLFLKKNGKECHDLNFFYFKWCILC